MLESSCISWRQVSWIRGKEQEVSLWHRIYNDPYHCEEISLESKSDISWTWQVTGELSTASLFSSLTTDRSKRKPRLEFLSNSTLLIDCCLARVQVEACTHVSNTNWDSKSSFYTRLQNRFDKPNVTRVLKEKQLQ